MSDAEIGQQSELLHDRVDAEVQRLQAEWPAGVELGAYYSSHRAQAPLSLYTAFQRIDPERWIRFSTAIRLLHGSVGCAERLTRRGVAVWSARLSASSLAGQLEAYRQLHLLIPARASFWERLRAGLIGYANARLGERRIESAPCPWDAEAAALTKELLIERAGLGKAVAAGLVELGGVDRLYPVLVRAISQWETSEALVQDVMNWRDDFRERKPNLVLCQVFESGNLDGSPGDQTTRIAEQVYKGRVAESVLTSAENALGAAESEVAALDVPLWRNHISAARDTIERLKEHSERLAGRMRSDDYAVRAGTCVSTHGARSPQRDVQIVIIDDIDAALRKLSTLGKLLLRPHCEVVRERVVASANKRGWRIVKYDTFAEWARQQLSAINQWSVLDPLFPMMSVHSVTLERPSRRLGPWGLEIEANPSSGTGQDLAGARVGLMDDATSSGATLMVAGNDVRRRGGNIAAIVMCCAQQHGRNRLTSAFVGAEWKLYVDGNCPTIHLRDGFPCLPHSGHRVLDEPCIWTRTGPIEARVPVNVWKGGLWGELLRDETVEQSIEAAKREFVRDFSLSLGREALVGDIPQLGTDATAPMLIDREVRAETRLASVID